MVETTFEETFRQTEGWPLLSRLMLVDLNSGDVLDTEFFVEEGRVARVAASEDPDGTTRCFITVTKQSGQSGTSGRNRVEVST